MAEVKKVMIAEDEDAIRSALSQALAAEGIEVVEAADGQAALDKALSEKPDLIVLDIIMPKLHGMDVYNGIRSSDWGSKVKIIILTNVGQDMKVQEASKHPDTELVVKNDSKLDEFVLFIKKHLT